MLGADENALTGLWIEGQKYFGGASENAFTHKPDLLIFARVQQWLDAYFRGEKPEISDLPLAPRGSAFRRKVWRILRDIPYGCWTTYGKIAKHTAVELNRETMSSQAIGGAVGHNPISIIIPCHRVVGSNGSLTGYAGGIHIKMKLLELEGVDLSHFFMPEKGTAL